MRIVFLDIDGVLNSHRHARTRPTPVSILGLDPAAVAHLNEICRRGDAHVVVTSTWRLHHAADELRDRLAAVGFTGRMIGTTPETPHLHRGTEIGLWLLGWTHAPIESLVVLDDDSADLGPWKQRLVKTTMAEGLMAEDVEMALAILARPLSVRERIDALGGVP